MVGSRRRLGCCVRFSFLCDLGADAGAGTFFQLAIRGLPLCPWRYNPYSSRALVMVREVRDKRALASANAVFHKRHNVCIWHSAAHD